MEWISVNDRLPENIRTVIVCVKEIIGVTTAWYGNKTGKWALTERDFSFLNQFTVTHWMPLPELPED